MRDDEVWVSKQFGLADLGDARRSRRAQEIAMSMLLAPGKGLAKQTRTWGGLKAAYRLLHCEDVTRHSLMQPHFEHTRAACLGQPVTLFVQDTTELDFTHMTHAEGYGPIGNHRGAGILAHTLMALTPEGQVLGLAAQHSWARSNDAPHKKTETRAQRKARPDKESEVWPKVLEAVGAVPPGHRWVSVGDRGSDSFDYWRRAGQLGWQCLSRIFINRRVGDDGHMLDKARALPAQGRVAIAQRARPGQAARVLQLDFAWSAVQVQPPRNDPAMNKAAPLSASVVRCWDAENNVQWVLLATWPLTSFEEAAQCVRWYAQRWSIEEFHKCLKTGCNLEKSQMKKAHAVEVLLGFCSIVAVRLLALARMARALPDEPASRHITPEYLAVVCEVQKLDARTLTVRNYWRMVARMGGFLARNSDGDPGWQTLWKGLLELESYVIGYRIGQKCG